MTEERIFVGLGANLPSPRHGPPLLTCLAAVAVMAETGMVVQHRSGWYRSLPVPPTGQPPFVNGVVEVRSHLSPRQLLEALHAIEADLGRMRGVRNAARIIDLDLLAYGDRVAAGFGGPVLPHPRLHRRAFVLRPLVDLAPDWRHPRLRRTVRQMLLALPPGQRVEPLKAGGRIAFGRL